MATPNTSRPERPRARSSGNQVRTHPPVVVPTTRGIPKPNPKMGISSELRQIQKAAAVLACIQLTAEHDNEVEADLADAIEVVFDVITAAATRIDARVSSSDEEDD